MKAREKSGGGEDGHSGNAIGMRQRVTAIASDFAAEPVSGSDEHEAEKNNQSPNPRMPVWRMRVEYWMSLFRLVMNLIFVSLSILAFCMEDFEWCFRFLTLVMLMQLEAISQEASETKASLERIQDSIGDIKRSIDKPATSMPENRKGYGNER